MRLLRLSKVNALLPTCLKYLIDLLLMTQITFEHVISQMTSYRYKLHVMSSGRATTNIDWYIGNLRQCKASTCYFNFFTLYNRPAV